MWGCPESRWSRCKCKSKSVRRVMLQRPSSRRDHAHCTRQLCWDKIPEVNQLKGNIYSSLSFQHMVAWPICFWACGRPSWWNKLLTLQQLRNRGEGGWVLNIPFKTHPCNLNSNSSIPLESTITWEPRLHHMALEDIEDPNHNRIQKSPKTKHPRSEQK